METSPHQVLKVLGLGFDSSREFGVATDGPLQTIGDGVDILAG